MTTLQDWKAALASGVKIETLLGLDQDATNKQTTGNSAGDKDQGTGEYQCCRVDRSSWSHETR